MGRSHLSRVMEKTVFRVSDQVRQKPACYIELEAEKFGSRNTLLSLHDPLETAFLQITMYLNTHFKTKLINLVIFLNFKSRKKCRKNFGNGSQIKILRPKIIWPRAFSIVKMQLREVTILVEK